MGKANLNRTALIWRHSDGSGVREISDEDAPRCGILGALGGGCGDAGKTYCFSQGGNVRRTDGRWRGYGLKKPLAIRIDADLLAATRDCARRDNRTLTNFIETALRQRIDEMMAVAREPSTATRKGHKA